ncbi:RNA polymerase sigma-70 factor [Dyadobacter luteus]|jgi:RNA polymerase sigma-70 factor (family 1)|uniref:RNA polymerase sigma-70 factor n=1 Tax=Dyadobacter luteus TaxID=2259619 RepID=A0A3D8YAX9_9BACT|nr:RNA polymerase sigma-70 factor [Dyadobacter luteus]REA60934.1 RNA polymerase sigma-70 factor [Dyadobacter luteus]
MQEVFVSDSELIDLLREGDENAFQEIYRRYWHKLYMVAARKAELEEDAEEIVQDIFVDLWERRGQVEIVELNKFLFSAVKYKVLNHIRSKMIRQEYSRETVRILGEKHSSTEEELALADLRQALKYGMAQLPLKSQEIFRLNRLEGLSVKEIAARLHIPERTIEYHITQSIRTMRVHLKDFILFVLVCFSI